MTTIIFISGNNTSKSLDLIQKSHWEETLKREFQTVEIKMLYSPYDMWNVEQVNTMVDKLSQEVENALGDVILFGYSFGGIIARLGYQKLSELDTRKVKVIVTMGTPHQIPSKRQRKFVEGTLGLKQSVNILILALTGYLDPFAMPLFAKLPGSNIKTKSLWCTHSGFFYSKNTRNKVVKEMKLFFSENSIL